MRGSFAAVMVCVSLLATRTAAETGAADAMSAQGSELKAYEVAALRIIAGLDILENECARVIDWVKVEADVPVPQTGAAARALEALRREEADAWRARRDAYCAAQAEDLAVFVRN